MTQVALEPWIVEAALARLSQPLRPADQRIIVTATRTPRKVRWRMVERTSVIQASLVSVQQPATELDAANSMIRFR